MVHRLLFIWLMLAISALHPELSEAQIGVVWKAPESSILAVSDLEQIRAQGITLVRTGPVTDEQILTMADSLGMTLFRELPINQYPAPVLLDSLEYARQILDALLSTASNHSSAGPIGLAVNSDTSEEEACRYFSSLVSGRFVPSQQQFYYVSAFVEDDRCRSAVDFVLLDALDENNPYEKLDSVANETHNVIGFAAVGKWVDPDQQSGLGARYSPEEQARFLENVIQEFDRRGGISFIFVHRWRDQSGTAVDGAFASDLYGRSYGMVDSNREPRVAMIVVSSYLLSGQTVFALEPNDDASITFPWFILLGWILIVTIAVLYASSPRFRYMLPRYFIAHGFFRNAVREAREVLPIVSTVLLTMTGVMVGMIGTQVFLTLHDTVTFKAFLSMQSFGVQSVVNSMLSIPLLSVILIGSLALLLIAVWMGLWMVIASRRAPLLPSQALMLGVWPRWQLLLLLPIAMAIHTLDSGAAIGWMYLLVPLWFGTALWASIRTTYDLYKITNCGLAPAIGIWLFNPAWLSFLAVFVLSLVYSEHASFIWHLMVRS